MLAVRPFQKVIKYPAGTTLPTGLNSISLFASKYLHQYY